jgi:ribonuclease HI
MPGPAPSRYAAFTDGSSLVNPGGPGGTGFVVLDRAAPAIRFGGARWVDDGPAGVTNNRMELRSVLDALHGIPEGETVLVTSDSRYVIDALTRWIAGWRRKGWRTSTGGPVMNRDLIEEIAAREERLRVRYAWVRGHVGHPVNEICDALASAAARCQPGPAPADVIAALRAQGLLGTTDDPRVVAGPWEAASPRPAARSQLTLGF